MLLFVQTTNTSQGPCATQHFLYSKPRLALTPQNKTQHPRRPNISTNLLSGTISRNVFSSFTGAAQYILQATNNQTGKNAGLCMHCTKTCIGNKWKMNRADFLARICNTNNRNQEVPMKPNKLAKLKPHFGWQALLLISFGMGKK